MQKFLLNRRSWMLALLAGTMPLATVGTCDYGPGGGTFFLDQGGHRGGDGVVFIDDGPSRGGFVDVFIDDGYYYEDDYYYEDEYYYEEDYYDEYCDDYFWDCW
ncbi:MAG: hypothetical protein GY778_27780 [bacterium]|nr:hypothetical protein [bacterium]